MNAEQIQAIIDKSEAAVKDLPQMSEKWKDALERLQLARLAQRADQIGDIRVVADPHRNHRQPEFDYPNNQKVIVKGKEFPYLIDEVDVGLLFGLAFKYLERNDASRFVAFAARTLGIESRWATIHRPDNS